MKPLVSKTLELLHQRIGVREIGHSNTGPEVSSWLRRVGADDGSPWCAACIYSAIDDAATTLKVINPFLRSAYTPDIGNWAREHHILVPCIDDKINLPEVGDIFLVRGAVRFHHIGIVRAVGQRRWGSIEGNAQPVSAPVLTPASWKQMGDLRVGDEVIDPHGKESKVTHIFPQGEKDVYRLTFSDATTVECTFDHLWAVRLRGDKNLQVVPTSKIASELMANRRPILPPILPPDLGASEALPVPPYALGLLIGDGGLSRHGSVWFTSKDVELVDAIREAFPDAKVTNLAESNHANDMTWRITYEKWEANPNHVSIRDAATGRMCKGNIPKTTRSNPLRRALNDLGLQCKSQEKRIPKQYLWTSAANRLALLQGIMDTDGHADLYGRMEWTTVSLGLAQDMMALVQSLGGKCKLQTKEVVWYTSPTQFTPKRAKKAYRLAIRLPEGTQAFRLARKQERVNARTPNRGATRAIVSCELVRREECQCIRVSAPSHLYVTNGFVPTHNSNSDGSREGYEVAANDDKPFVSRFWWVKWGVLCPNPYVVAAPQTRELILGGKRVFDMPVAANVSLCPVRKWCAWMRWKLEWANGSETPIRINGHPLESDISIIDNESYVPMRDLVLLDKTLDVRFDAANNRVLVSRKNTAVLS